ncbi:AfsR/SARP family transcriptional regulator [Lentzea guizhouensis]|uniref:AfsR/SARP family transcriptional regulator n=1 Tax=Lentzea guizhouensis TaxID=1586287 RepID=UPI000ABD8335|nr:BTAD domain-containing putative transcriptional regulator [Lentzea guizhouensis]
MTFHVPGPLEAHTATDAVVELGTRKAGTVLAVLLLHPNAWLRTDEIVRATWPEHAVPAAAKANLTTYVSQLRCVLPSFGSGNRIEARSGAYRLRVGRGEVDSDRAFELAAAARAAMSAGDHGAALVFLEDALALWRGRPFEGADVADVVGRLDGLRLDLVEGLAEAQLALGRRGEALAALRELTVQDPLREGAWTLLGRTLVATGRRGGAVAACRAAGCWPTSSGGAGPELAGRSGWVRELPADVAVLAGGRRSSPRCCPRAAGWLGSVGAVVGQRGGVLAPDPWCSPVSGSPGSTGRRLDLAAELLDAAPGVALTAAVTTEPAGGAALRVAATTHAAITAAAAELTHVAAHRGVRLERLDGRHASAVAATLPIGGGSL